MDKPCMPEAGLLDEPLQAMQDRLHQLLAEWPENPILTQLLVLCQRLTGAPLSLPRSSDVLFAVIQSVASVGLNP